MAQEPTKKETTVEDLDLDAKVKVRSIAGYRTGFSRIESVGDVEVMANGVFKLARSEIIAQTQRPNNLFNGVDGVGSHAVYYIEDAPTREYLGFDDPSEKRKQNVFSDEKVKEVFDIKSQSKFESAVREQFITRAEKLALIESIRRLGINDYAKIRFAENYTGFKYDAPNIKE